jgi:hypothetical protein
MPDNFTPTERITTKEAAELIGYNVVIPRWLARIGRVEGRKFGGDWLLSRESVLALIEEVKRSVSIGKSTSNRQGMDAMGDNFTPTERITIRETRQRG